MTRCKHPGCNRKISFVYKSIGLCRCGNVYCQHHRLDHKCTFDYKSHNKKVLSKELRKVVAEKIIEV